MNGKGYAPERFFTKITPRIARGLARLAGLQSGELTDPRRVGCSLIEDGLMRGGLIDDEKEIPPVVWPAQLKYSVEVEQE